MEDTVVAALSQFPPELVKTITCDRGTEFANWANIEKRLNCDVYSADPYCARQKGTNENSNALLREFCPNGRNFSKVSPKTLKRNLVLINARPRKVLGFHYMFLLVQCNLAIRHFVLSLGASWFCLQL